MEEYFKVSPCKDLNVCLITSQQPGKILHQHKWHEKKWRHQSLYFQTPILPCLSLSLWLKPVWLCSAWGAAQPPVCASSSQPADVIARGQRSSFIVNSGDFPSQILRNFMIFFKFFGEAMSWSHIIIGVKWLMYKEHTSYTLLELNYPPITYQESFPIWCSI